MQLGKESDEPAVIAGVLNTPEGKSILQANPPFIYVPSGADPLIIPWVRDQVIFQEKLDEASKLLAEGKATRKVDVLKKALETIATVPTPPDQQSTTALATLRNDIGKEIRTLETVASTGDTTTVTAPTPVVVTLPEPVRATTNGVIVDRENPNESMVVVGDYMLRPGQTVPRFPAVRVKSISKQSVIYEFRGKEFVVNVRSD